MSKPQARIINCVILIDMSLVYSIQCTCFSSFIVHSGTVHERAFDIFDKTFTSYLYYSFKVVFWARLFKTNDIVSEGFGKISNVNISSEIRQYFLLTNFTTKISVHLIIKSYNT